MKTVIFKIIKAFIGWKSLSLKKSINGQIGDYYNKCQEELGEARHVNHTWNLSTQLAGQPECRGHPGLHVETLSQIATHVKPSSMVPTQESVLSEY